MISPRTCSKERSNNDSGEGKSSEAILMGSYPKSRIQKEIDDWRNATYLPSFFKVHI